MELGLRPDELLSLAPADAAALRKAWAARESRQDYRFGLLASLLANAHRDPKRKPQPFTPADFFPSLARARRGRMSNEEIMAAARRIVGKPPPSKRKASS